MGFSHFESANIFSDQVISFLRLMRPYMELICCSYTLSA
nr:MAG TPA: hypothetical protein [Caudoviricetes sp.]